MASESSRENQSVIAIVKGGLGNQLFIYAAARALALRTGRSLYLDTRRGYTHDNYGRSCRLDRFPIQAEPMPEHWRVAPTLKHPQHKLIRALNKLLPREHREYLAERHHLDADQLTELALRRKRVTLLGYWQQESYFSHCAEVIRRELAPPEPKDLTNLERGHRYAAGETVFVHFRRILYQHVLGLDYYQRAIDEVCGRLAEPKFVLFGDEIPSAGLDFHGWPVEIVADNGDDELADLWLMTQCDHAIIANSSFSWWGAWLGPTKKGGLVISAKVSEFSNGCPQVWLKK